MTLRRIATAVATVALLAAAGCSTSGGTSPTPTASPGTTAISVPPTATSLPTASSSPAAPTSSTPTPAPTTSATTGSPTPPPAPASSAPTTPAAPRSTCATVTTRVINGSGTNGREFAALQFTNAGSADCELRGYATVTLLLKGRVVGRVSTPASSGTSARHLAAGDTAESLLDDYVMNCQAPLSDTVRVQLPGSDTVVERPGVLRACTLRVGPLGAPE